MQNFEKEKSEELGPQIYIQKINGIIGVLENGYHLDTYSICNRCARILFSGVQQCPKIKDIVKKPLDRYDFITDGYQSFMLVEKNRTILEQHVDYDNNIPKEKILTKAMYMQPYSLAVYKCKGFIKDTRE
ncbi:MAG: hypothetical protein RSB99_00720 [Bacilli bacterium]